MFIMVNKKIGKNDTNVIKWMFTVCKKQFPMMILLVVLNAIYGISSVFFAKFSKSIIDGATQAKDFNIVIKFALCMLFLVAFQMILNITKNSLSERCSARLEMILKKYILDLVIKKDYQCVTSYHTGDLQNRMFNDVTLVANGFTTIIPESAYFGAKLLSSLIYLIVIDKIFALIFVIGGFTIFFITRILRKTLKKLHKKVQETEGKTRSFIQEILTNLLVIKAFAVDEKVNETTDELQNDNFKARMTKRNFSICANVGLGSIFSIGTVFAIAFGAYGILFKAMTYGTVTAIIQLVNQVQSPFVSLSGIMPKYYNTIASAERLMELDDLPDEEEINKNEIDKDAVYRALKSIEFENITFSFDRDFILDNTSLSINKGDFVAIMGISGIGKSTLLKLLLGVFNVNSGSIYLNTDNSKIFIDKNTRKLFSYVPQGNMLISGTIKDNITFINPSATDDEIAKAIEISCAKQFIDELPLGIETVIGEKGMGLSEGQIQRLAIARSLLANSPVLLLDEATSALDEQTEKQFLTNLKTLDNITCLIVSHKKAALDICNKSIKIKNGKIISEG
ncbi:MAG TPA: ABC transporter ATP-binding protein [Ruminococcaceae bacterium]|jgi:ABC transporter related protein|nr:ABC transporter ATP-binding protein [Oscillospiraceae bacterium]